MVTTLSALFISASAHFGLPAGLLSSVCFVETRHNVEAVHIDDGGENSLGVCQIKLSTARWLGYSGADADLMDPKINIFYAAKYLAKQISRYNGDIAKGVVAYNRGNAIGLTESEYSLKVFEEWISNQGGKRYAYQN